MAEISRDMDPEAAEAVARLLHFFGAGNSADSYTAPLFDVVTALEQAARTAGKLAADEANVALLRVQALASHTGGVQQGTEAERDRCEKVAEWCRTDHVGKHDTPASAALCIKAEIRGDADGPKVKVRIKA